MGAALTLTTAEPTAAAGRMVRRTATECVPAPRAKAPTAVPGTMDLRCPASILGQAEAALKVNGRMAKDMDWVWKQGGDGYTEENGHRVLRVDTVYDNPTLPPLNTREHGPTDFKMDMARKLTQMKEHTRDNG